MSINQLAKQAKSASSALTTLSTADKNRILLTMADNLLANEQAILEANTIDMTQGKQKQLSPALLDRLRLSPERIQAMADGIRQIAALADPVGEKLAEHRKDNGLVIEKVRVPIGVIAMIYESRPNVTADVTALCLKTSNAIILRGGAEAWHSNHAILNALLQNQSQLPEHAVQLIETTDRQAVTELIQLDQYIDLVIPRGGEGLIEAVVKNARVPVIKHYKGLCHIFVDQSADINDAINIIENAKCQRPGVCNAVETLLVHEAIAPTLLPALYQRLNEQGVELRGDKAAKHLVPELLDATEADWHSEYLDLILSIKVVSSVDEAIEHINFYGSHHSDAILTQDSTAADAFCLRVDSAAVYVNASTRFTDGAEFGMGAEIGISTDKLHARGPMGLPELTTYKYVIKGHGQVR